MKEESSNALSGREAQAQFGPLLMPKLQLPRMQKSLLGREHLLQELDRSLLLTC